MTIAGHRHDPRTGPASTHVGNRAAAFSAVLGVLGLAALAWAWLLTTTIDPPNWVRVPGLVLLPVGVLGSIGVGAVGLLTPPRRWAVVGVTLGVMGVAGLVALQLAYG